MEKIFEGLSEEEKLIYNDLKGPSWSPKKDKIVFNIEKEESKIESESPTNDLNNTKDSVRAIMLIRAYRIRGHLIANLDPLNLQKKRNILS